MAAGGDPKNRILICSARRSEITQTRHSTARSAPRLSSAAVARAGPAWRSAARNAAGRPPLIAFIQARETAKEYSDAWPGLLIKIPPADLARLNLLAQREKLSVSAVVRRTIYKLTRMRGSGLAELRREMTTEPRSRADAQQPEDRENHQPEDD